MRRISVLIMGIFFLIAMPSPAKAMADFGFMQDSLEGKQAADFTLPTVHGQNVNLAQYSGGSKTIIFFWATWCPHCREALKKISLMHAEIEAKGITLILVSIGESKEMVKNYLNTNQYQFDVVLDQNQSLSDSYQIQGIPTIFYLDENRKIKSIEHLFSGDYEKNF